jgi:hypothetical protein
MAYHIKKIFNYSPKSVVLTNPKALRDRHLVTKGTTLLDQTSARRHRRNQQWAGDLQTEAGLA